MKEIIAYICSKKQLQSSFIKVKFTTQLSNFQKKDSLTTYISLPKSLFAIFDDNVAKEKNLRVTGALIYFHTPTDEFERLTENFEVQLILYFP